MFRYTIKRAAAALTPATLVLGLLACIAILSIPQPALCDMPPEPPGTNRPPKRPVKPAPQPNPNPGTNKSNPNPFPGNGSGARPR